MAAKPFFRQRRIAFGDCDPARIYYTPRAIDFVVEAVESWSEEVLGLVWGKGDDAPFELLFVRIDCDYLRPLTAGQVIQLLVWVVRAGNSSITFCVRGQNGAGEPCFHAILVACLVAPANFQPLPIPPGYRKIIDHYQDRFPAPTPATGGPARSARFPGRPLSPGRGTVADEDRLLLAGSTEWRPFSRPRRVMCGDCGSAGTIYAPKAFDYAVETIDEWFEEVLGVSWLELVSERHQGAPFVSAVCDYLRPVGPGQVLTVTLHVIQLGGASIGFSVTGHDAGGHLSFAARLAACFIDQKGFRSMRIPEDLRRRIEAYQAACGSRLGEITFR